MQVVRIFFSFLLIVSVIVSLVFSSKVLEEDEHHLCLFCQNCSHSFRSHLLGGDLDQLKPILVEYFLNEDSQPCHFFNQLVNFISKDIPFLLKQECFDNFDKYRRISDIFKLFLSVYRNNFNSTLVNIDRSFGRIKVALQEISNRKIRQDLLEILSKEITNYKPKKTKTKTNKKRKTWHGPRRNLCLLCRNEKDHTFLQHVLEHSPEKPIGYFAVKYFETHESQKKHIFYYMERLNTYLSVEIDDLLKDPRFHSDGDKKGVLVEVFDQLISVYKNFHNPTTRSTNRFYTKFTQAIFMVEDESIKKDLQNVLVTRLGKNSTNQVKYSLSFKISEAENGIDEVGESSQISDQSIDTSQQTKHLFDRILPSINDICEWPPSSEDNQSLTYASDIDFYQKNPTLHCSQHYKSVLDHPLTSKKPFVPLKTSNFNDGRKVDYYQIFANSAKRQKKY